DIIRGEPQVTFSVLNIGAHPGWHGEPRFTFPPNVLALEEIFCQDAAPTPLAGPERAKLERAIRRCRQNASRRTTPSRMLRGLRRLHFEDTVDDELLADLATADLSISELLYGHESFTLCEEMSTALAPAV